MMRKLLVAINVLLVFTILGVAFFWNPDPEVAPLPGTHAARVGGDVTGESTPNVMIPATADGTTAGQISIINPYVRLAPPGTKVSGAYMTLRNAGDHEARLVSAVATVADVTELHNHINDDGVMRMRQVKEIVVPARGEVQLKPGSFHVMLIDMKTSLKEGDQVAISLGFADGSSKRVEVPVVRPTTVIAPQD
jgi:copper(I)-binding protein